MRDIDDAPYDSSRHIVSRIRQRIRWEYHTNLDGTVTGYNYWTNYLAVDIVGASVGGSCTIASVQTPTDEAGTDNSANWKHLSLPFKGVYFHPTDGTVIYALQAQGLLAYHFTLCPPEIPSASGIVLKPCDSPSVFFVDPVQPSRMFVGTHDTLWNSTDAGATWFSIMAANVASIVRVPGMDAYVFAVADSLKGGLYLSSAGGAAPVVRVYAEPVFAMDADPRTRVVYAGGQGIVLRSTRQADRLSFTEFDTVPGHQRVIGVAAIDGTVLCADTATVYESSGPSGVEAPSVAPGTVHLTSFPNPFAGRTTIVLEGWNRSLVGTASVEIVDMVGRTVATAPISECGAEFDASGIAPGVYDCVMRIGNRNLRTMLVRIP